jgi:hypothetical protein
VALFVPRNWVAVELLTAAKVAALMRSTRQPFEDFPRGHSDVRVEPY